MCVACPSKSCNVLTFTTDRAVCAGRLRDKACRLCPENRVDYPWPSRIQSLHYSCKSLLRSGSSPLPFADPRSFPLSQLSPSLLPHPHACGRRSDGRTGYSRTTVRDHVRRQVWRRCRIRAQFCVQIREKAGKLTRPSKLAIVFLSCHAAYACLDVDTAALPSPHSFTPEARISFANPVDPALPRACNEALSAE